MKASQLAKPIASQDLLLMKNPSDLPLFSQTKEVAAASATAATSRRWTVTELTTQIRGTLEPAFSQIWVQGEVSNYRPAASGHIYFSLKDQGACISVALFGWGVKKRNFDLRDGLQVLCRGKISVYPPRGNYQLIVDQMEPLGTGALQIAFEKLKAKLAAEGLFESERKRALPRFPTRIAVITSPTGAVIQDMLNILKRRAPHLRITVIPALVQGDEAHTQIIRGLKAANRHRLGDVIVLARGGGSIEDLWCFNHEELARAIAQSELPVISAVGHEVDFTISDFVADLRAPTPSAAAEIVSGNWAEVSQKVIEHSKRLRMTMMRDLLTRKNLLTHLSARVISPKDRLREQAQRVDDMAHRLDRAMQQRLERRKNILHQWMGKLDALSPLRVLERGYTLVKDPAVDGSVVKSAHAIKSGQELEITFYDGQRAVRAI
jgi:exodeoxyribonuclease VII large subunit